MLLEALRHGRGRGSANRSITESPMLPRFSENFLLMQAQQRALDAQFADFTPNRHAPYLNSGGDHVVRRETIDGKKIVVKELKRTSREYLVFGYGIDPELVANDRDEAIRVARTRQQAPPEEIAEKMRLVHILESTHMETHATVPTAIIVRDGEIYRIQREIPYVPAISEFERNLQSQRAHLFYETRKREWSTVTRTQDFQQSPKDVKDYWRTFLPDHGHGGNAFFQGLGCKPEFYVVDL
jgi:hypothetical protein